MTLSERVAYIRGLREGLKLNADRPETQLFDAILDLLDDMADNAGSLQDSLEELTAQTDAIDIDLGNLESFLLADPDEAFADDEDDDFDYELALADYDDSLPGAASEPMYEVQCPACGESIYVDDGILDEGGIECPNCGEKLEFDIEFEDEPEQPGN